jgi:hypothetical protein
MAEEVTRCPYCVLDDHFRPMLLKPGGWFVCQKCAHIANPGKPYYECSCQKCEDLNRVA